MPAPVTKNTRGTPPVRSLYEAQTRKYQAQAEREELRNAEESKRLVDRTAMQNEWFKCARQVRDAMENLPSRLAGILAAERHQEKVFMILQKEIRQALEGLIK